MKVRTPSKWRNDSRPRTVEETATALAYRIWQIALDATKNLHAEDFRYDNDTQRLAVLVEYLIFLVHAADRFVHHKLDQNQRQRFVSRLGLDTASHYKRNAEELQENNDFGTDFIDKLNQRICLYADMPGRGNRPGYEMLCLLGTEVQEIMGLSQTNKWIQQQVIDIDGPDTVDRLHQVLSGLLDSAGITSPP